MHESVGGDYELREYSGRAMYGDKCLGITGDLGKIVAGIIGACLNTQMPDEAAAEIERAVSGLRTDSMGRDTVVYFPGVPYTEPKLCDYDDCADEATHSREDARFCRRHAAQHDRVVASMAADRARRD